MKFDLPSELSSIIKVVGVGGGGSNAVNHMHAQGIRGVDFLICNTDKQALDMSPVPVKLQLGAALTEGLGAGSKPERGEAAAKESIDEIRELLNTRTKMIFVTAGMGGGTGTGAAPVVARAARDMGILTVGIVTMPFNWEGRKRLQQATAGVEEMRQAVDTLIVINNDRLGDLYGDLQIDDAFAHADNVLSTAARGIAEVIMKEGKINVDFEDVRTVMAGSGVALMGMAEAEGEDRALRAVQDALASPLLNDNDITGATYVLLNIAQGTKTMSMAEMNGITDHIQDVSGSTADVIWGYCKDESLGEKVRVTVIATGFKSKNLAATLEQRPEEKKIIDLNEDRSIIITAPITNPVQTNITPEKAPAPAPVTEMFVKNLELPVKEQTRFQFDPEPAQVEQQPKPGAQVEATASGKVVHNLHEEGNAKPEHVHEEPANHAMAQPANGVPPQGPAPAANHNRVEERLAHMREVNMRLRTPNGLAEMEREPAFKRRNIELLDGPRSTDSNVSRYTLTETNNEHGERQVELRRNNPFLHDNVD